MVTFSANTEQISKLVPDYYAEPINGMLDRIFAHRYRHRVRQFYIDGVQSFKNLGISIPPVLSNIDSALGWAGKAIDSVSQRIMFDGYTMPGGDISDFGIDDIVDENILDLENKRAHSSTLAQASTFQAVFRGNTDAGEPEVVVQTFEATNATGIYNAVTKRLDAALTILNEDDFAVKRFLAYFDKVILDFRYDSDINRWSVEGYENELGVVPVVPLTYGATISRPFGKSYLTREMMTLIDNGVRTVARNEIAAELFTTPQRYLLGADPKHFMDSNGKPIPAWNLTMGQLMTVPYNKDDADVMPEVGSFDSVSPTPGISLLHSYAAQFAAAAKIPLSALGVEHSNPASAEGVHAVREDLFKTIHDANRDFGVSHKRVMQLAVALKNDLDFKNLPDELKKLTINWRDPATPTMAASADATLKLVSAGILPADSEVTMRRAGLTEADIQSIVSYREKYGAIDKLAGIIGKGSSYQSINRLAQNSPVEE